MNISHLWNNTVETKRNIKVNDKGVTVDTFVTNIASLDCRIQQDDGPEVLEGGRSYSKLKYILYCDKSADILMDDIVVFESNDYNVVNAAPEGNQGIYRKVKIERTN